MEHPMECLKWSTPKSNFFAEIKCFINMVTHLDVHTLLYYPTALRRVQITPKTSTNITRYLYSSGPVRQVFS